MRADNTTNKKLIVMPASKECLLILKYSVANSFILYLDSSYWDRISLKSMQRCKSVWFAADKITNKKLIVTLSSKECLLILK